MPRDEPNPQAQPIAISPVAADRIARIVMALFRLSYMLRKLSLRHAASDTTLDTAADSQALHSALRDAIEKARAFGQPDDPRAVERLSDRRPDGAPIAARLSEAAAGGLDRVRRGTRSLGDIWAGRGRLITRLWLRLGTSIGADVNGLVSPGLSLPGPNGNRLPSLAGGGGTLAMPVATPFDLATFQGQKRPEGAKDIRFGYLVIATFIGGLLLWSGMAPLSTAAIAPGQIIAEGNKRVVQHLEGGIIREFLVRDGDEVEAGQVIIRLDDSQSGAQSELLLAQTDALRARDARLSAEAAGTNTIAFPEDLLARRDDPRVAEIITGQESIFANRRQIYRGQLSILQQRIEQANAVIAGAMGQIAGMERQAELLNKEIDDVSGLVDKGYMPRPRLLALQRELARVVGEQDRLKGDVARTRQQIGETNLQITQIRNTQMSEGATEQRETREKLAEIEQRLRAASDVQTRREIVAPVTGIVTNLKHHTIGGVVQPGTTILEIVPRNETLVVEARIHPTDIDIVGLDLKADVRLSAFKQRTMPLLHGSVTYVASDIVTEERTGQSYYRATVLIDAEELNKVHGVRLTSGMPAEVMIHAGERTLIEYILGPIKDSFRRSFREV